MQNKISILLVLVTLLSLFGVASVVGHPKHKPEKPKTPPVVVSDTTGRQSAVAEPQAEHPYVLKLSDALVEHIHNKIVHFPIGFTLAAVLLSLIGVRRREAQSYVRWLILAAGVFSVIALITGLIQAGVFEQGSKQWVVELHERLGIASTGALWLWTLFSFVRSLQRYAWFVGIGVVGLILVTGFFGGILAHG